MVLMPGFQHSAPGPFMMENKVVEVDLWDTADDPATWADADLFVVVYNANSVESCGAVETWIEGARADGPAGACLAIFANQMDQIAPSPSELGGTAAAEPQLVAAGRAIADDQGAVFATCSATTREGLNEALQAAVRSVLVARGVLPALGGYKKKCLVM